MSFVCVLSLLSSKNLLLTNTRFFFFSFWGVLQFPSPEKKESGGIGWFVFKLFLACKDF